MSKYIAEFDLQDMRLYMVRDKLTGKFVNDITNPRHKYWKYRKSAENAINNYHKEKYKIENFEVVGFDLVEALNND